MKASDGAKPKNTVNQSIKRAFQILDFLNQSSTPVSAIEISNALSLNRATTYGLLETLETLGFIEREENGAKFQLTTQLYEMGIMYPKKLRVVQISENTMRDMAKEFHVSANLGILKHNYEVLSIASVAGDITQSFLLQSGRHLPIHATGMGKLFLSDMEDDLAYRILTQSKLVPLTSHTITDPQKLIEELHKIRLQGYATDEREYLDDSGCLSFPIRDSSRRIIAALSLSGSYGDISEKKERIVSKMVSKCYYLSTLLGYTM